MRDFRLQTIVNCLKIIKQKELTWGELIPYVWLWVKPSSSSRVTANKMYDRNDLSKMKRQLYGLGKTDPAWFPRLFEPTTLGIRSWEYGLLLSQNTFRNKTVLDAGCGNSRLPRYLSKIGAKITLLDMDNPLEETEKKKDKNLRFVLGDMTNLKFKDRTFDRVICISAIEHVDMKQDGGFYQAKEYNQRAMQAIRELARVTRKGGLFYLTTDFYLPNHKTDRWVGSTEKEIHGAFPWENINLFAKEMERNGIMLSTKLEAEEKTLRGDSGRANYRGRYFTTVAFMGKKI